MKAILEIPEKKFKVEFENLTISQFCVVGERLDKSGFIVENYRISEPITLITSNMPEDLKISVESLIRQYCNI